MSNRDKGVVARVLGDYGFITCPNEDQDLYFKTTWFKDNPPLSEGDEVEFEVRRFDDNSQAHYIERTSASASRPPSEGGNQPDTSTGLPTSDRLFDWAYLGHMPDVLEDLKQLALPERWDFKNEDSNSDWPYPILVSHLMETFGRLVIEGKVAVGIEGKYAAFNTGLVDSRYEPIYALFVRNAGRRTEWKLSSFCITGEGRDGQNLVRYFSPLPETAHYFDDATELDFGPLR